MSMKYIPYRNIAMMAIRSGRFNWASDFSHNYADKLRPGERGSAFHFNMAQITYHNKQYHASLEHLSCLILAVISFTWQLKRFRLKYILNTESMIS